MKSPTWRLPKALGSRFQWNGRKKEGIKPGIIGPRKSKGPRMFPTIHSPGPNKSILKVWPQRFPSVPSFDCSAFFLIYGKRTKRLISLHLPKKKRLDLPFLPTRKHGNTFVVAEKKTGGGGGMVGEDKS